MESLKVLQLSGERATFDEATVEKLRSSLRGGLLLPNDEGFDKARTVWNAMIHRSPALVVRCAGVADIRQAVTFAHEHRLLTAVKGGGHNIAGNAVCEGGLLIDLSAMRAVTVDPIAAVAQVEPGATLGDFDHECQAFGLATPVGINSTTGVAGLTLGGGFGWLSRKYGMTVDNLMAADVITADGRLLRASDKENPDLFWAIRGGSGNFGVVSRFEFKLHPVGPEVLSGLIVYALKDATSALKLFRDYVKKLGNDTNVWTVMRKAPPLPFLPPEVHGTEIIAFCVFHAGDPDEGRKAIEPLRKLGTVLGEYIGMQPYTAWQQTFDPLLAPGARNYWKSHNFVDLSDGAIDVAVKYVQSLPSPHCEIFFGLIGGATTRPKPDATAYSHRDAIYVCNVHGRWETAAEDQKGTAWARGFFREAAPYATGGVYVNFLTDDEPERIKAAYGPGYERLVSAKKKYDPDNLFRMNQNIRPSP
ncbi:FAD linked oxidase-like [Rhodoferax ferrireducens T118]|uniref:FAD linked oxidase-like n=1 Tax=Albidiferax ferrireducens (strain ATCC BAA-621 / DSM 15236 / T118) TaxID=338969 RepID=Q21W00_ALBFT|nr:FAD-binding oxidoreductase [Rhodoferax ferrireducens]ABD70053.1 FAD linked oxidase-like [Rhodoferax ferrireducens T118]